VQAVDLQEMAKGFNEGEFNIFEPHAVVAEKQ
jgi:hypothetical protein